MFTKHWYNTDRGGTRGPGGLMGRRPNDNTPPRRTKNFRPHRAPKTLRGFRKHFRLEIMTRRIVWLGGRHSHCQQGAVFVTPPPHQLPLTLSLRSPQKIHYHRQCVVISTIGESARPRTLTIIRYNLISKSSASERASSIKKRRKSIGTKSEASP